MMAIPTEELTDRQIPGITTEYTNQSWVSRPIPSTDVFGHLDYAIWVIERDYDQLDDYALGLVAHRLRGVVQHLRTLCRMDETHLLDCKRPKCDLPF